MCVPEGGGGEDSDDDADVDADAETAVVPGMEEADMLAEPKAEAFVGLDRFVPIRNIDKCIRTSSSRPGNVAKVAKSRDVGAVGIEKQGHRVRGSSERHIERNKKMEDQQIEGRRLCTRNYGIVVTHGQKVSVKSGLALELQVHRNVKIRTSDEGTSRLNASAHGSDRAGRR